MIRTVAAKLLTGLVALEHVGFLVLEMLFWDHPVGQRIFAMTPDYAAQSAVLAANQGLYNGFLAAGLIWGLVAGRTAALTVSTTLAAGRAATLTVSATLATRPAAPFTAASASRAGPAAGQRTAATPPIDAGIPGWPGALRPLRLAGCRGRLCLFSVLGRQWRVRN
jgi:putative membrane protein